MTAYYNEHDIYAAQWLRNLIEAGQIAPGIVDERSIEDVHPSDLRGFTQCHFFAGIGVWSYAIRSAGWSDDREIWTGSCPCQPFSAAGKGAGENDKRHLWPVFAKLIDACRPPAILGEQVASNLITGKRVSEHLQRLWERKARLGVLADWLEEDLSLSMQGVPEQAGARISADAQRINGDQSLQAGGSSEITRSDKGPSIRVDSGMGASSARHGSLRSNWDRLRSDGKPWLEYSFSGSGASGVRVHEGQHAGGLVRLERGMRELGGEQGDRDGQCHHETPERAIQRASKATDRELEKEDGGAWIDTLQLDLEGMDYSFCCIPFPSAGVGAPHIRDRLYWVADSAGAGSQGGQQPWERADSQREATERGGAAGGMADTIVQQRSDGQHGIGPEHDAAGREQGAAATAGLCSDRGLANTEGPRPPHRGAGAILTFAAESSGNAAGGLADAADQRQHGRGASQTSNGRDAARVEPERLCDGGRVADTASQRERTNEFGSDSGHGIVMVGSEPRRDRGNDGSNVQSGSSTGPVNGFWSDADWLFCRDGKWRPVEPGTFPLVAGPSGGMGRVRADWHTPAGKEGFGHRAGRLKGYGNAISAEAARIFIECVMEVRA